MAKKKSKAYSHKELEMAACLASLNLGDYYYDDYEINQFTVICSDAYEHTFVRNKYGHWECNDIDIDENFNLDDFNDDIDDFDGDDDLDDLDDDEGLDDFDDFNDDDFDDFNDFDKDDFDNIIDGLDDDDDDGDNLKSSLIAALEQVYQTNHTILPPCKL